MRVAYFVKSAVAVVGLIAALGVQPLGAQTPVTVRIGTAPLDSNGPVYYALDLGYFKDAGIDIEFASGLNNAAAALAALSGGSIDLASASLTSIAAAHDAGIGFKIVASAQTSDGDAAPSEFLAVRKDATTKTAADLAGKTIGIIGIKSLMQVAAMAWMDKHGADAKSLKFVEIPVPQMCAQLDGGRVDAVIMVEPFLTGCADARVIGNVDDGIAPRFFVTGVVGMDTWLASHRDLAARFATALAKAAAWGNTHPRESSAILVKYARLDPTLAAQMKRARYGTEVSAATIQPVIDASAKYGTIPHAFPASEIIWSR